MKWIRFAFFLSVLLMVSGEASTKSEDDEWQWRTEPPLASYSATYHLFQHEQPARCFVNTRGDGRGTDIVSEVITNRNTENEKDFLQTIAIERDSSGTTTAKEVRYSRVFEHLNLGQPFYPDKETTYMRGRVCRR
jgi:hypothetical protein